MTPIRLGAVTYLNARPLVYGLEAQPERFSIRFDIPSVCAELLGDRSIDIGLVPCVEYLRRPEYRIVPGVAVASHGPVASVAMYTSRELSTVRSIAVDTSSRTSVILLRVLCARWFHLEPRLEPMAPDLNGMLARCDAALVIGDPALFIDEQAQGLQKFDFGDAWRSLTGLPFVYAFWAGWPGVTSQDVAALQEARALGAVRVADVARRYFGDDEARVAMGTRYLRENVSFSLGEAEREGLACFYRYASELGLVAEAPDLRFYQTP